MSKKDNRFSDYSIMTAKLIAEKIKYFSIKCFIIFSVVFLVLIYKVYSDISLLKEENKHIYSLSNSEFIEVRNKSVFIGWVDKSKKIKTYYTVEIPLKTRK